MTWPRRQDSEDSEVAEAAPRSSSLDRDAAEPAMPLPGDDLVASPNLATTHAVTISAPPLSSGPGS